MTACQPKIVIDIHPKNPRTSFCPGGQISVQGAVPAVLNAVVGTWCPGEPGSRTMCVCGKSPHRRAACFRGPRACGLLGLPVPVPEPRCSSVASPRLASRISYPGQVGFAGECQVGEIADRAYDIDGCRCCVGGPDEPDRIVDLDGCGGGLEVPVRRDPRTGSRGRRGRCRRGAGSRWPDLGSRGEVQGDRLGGRAELGVAAPHRFAAGAHMVVDVGAAARLVFGAARAGVERPAGAGGRRGERREVVGGADRGRSTAMAVHRCIIAGLDIACVPGLHRVSRRSTATGCEEVFCAALLVQARGGRRLRSPAKDPRSSRSHGAGRFGGKSPRGLNGLPPGA